MKVYVRSGGFTLIEMMIALSIGVIMLTAIGGLLMSVWMLAKESSDEMQCTLRSCATRNRLMHQLVDTNGKKFGFGLLNATNIVCCDRGAKAVYAVFPHGVTWSVDMTVAKERDFYQLDDTIDTSKWSEWVGKPIQHVYLKIKEGRTTYYERLIVPVCGQSEKFDDKRAFVEGIGGSAWRF